MKHWAMIAAISLLGVAAILTAERRKVDAAPGPSAVLYLIADTEQELTRMPVRFTRMSDAEEIAIGNQLAKFYQPQSDDEPDPERQQVQSYLKTVGAKVATGAHRKLPYQFHYLDEPYLVNAFAIPGGHVYVGEGLLSLMDSEDELASVLGHEIEHIDHYHCAERAQQEQALRKIPLGGLLAIPIEVFEAGYSKTQELEADREGTQLAVAAGYSPSGAIRMFETFDRLYRESRSRPRNPEQELTEMARQTLEGYFRSHPLPSERIAQIQKLIAEQKWDPIPERDLKVADIFWARKAELALHAHKYSEAMQLAGHSLKINPRNRKALRVAADSEFYQAEFRRAADFYRQLLDQAPTELQIARSYALALAAAGRQSAFSQFQAWMNSIQGTRPRGVAVQAAGLALLAGDPLPARKAAAETRQSTRMNTSLEAAEKATTEARHSAAMNPSTEAADALADLAWWYYLSGDSQTALQAINDAVQLRPSESRYRIQAAWIAIEQKRLADATENLEAENTSAPEKYIAQAVLQWQEGETEKSLLLFNNVLTQAPEWRNMAWVRSLYSPLVAQSLQQMQAEAERRRRASLVRPR